MKKNAYIVKFLFLLLVLMQLSELSAKLPGWLTVTDKDDNTYYVAPGGKIITLEEPDFTYKAVSAQGISYYLRQGEILSKGFYKFEGLLLLKSIRYLSDVDTSMEFAGGKATTLIHQLEHHEGDRFAALNDAASVLLCKRDDQSYLYNDRFGYTLSAERTFDLLKRKRIRETHYYSDSLLLGAKDDKENKGYDFLVLVNGESLEYGEYKNIDDYIENYKRKKGSDSYERSEIERSEYSLLSEISMVRHSKKYATPDDPFQAELVKSDIEQGEAEAQVVDTTLRGVEMVITAKGKGLVCQIIASEENYAQHKEQMTALAKSIRLSPR